MDTESKAHPRQFVAALGRGFNLLDIICKSPTPLGLSQLAKACHLSVSTIQRLIFTLQDMGLVSRDPRTKKYQVGPRVISLAFAVMDNLELKKVAAPIMAQLADEVDEVIGLGALSGHQVVLLAIVLKTQKIININVTPGDTLPLHATASGKVILAFSDKPQRDILLKNNAMTELTSRTISSLEVFEAQLKKVRQSGFATAIDEGSYGLSTIAAPVRNNRGEVVAALTIMVPTARTLKGAITAYRDKIIQTADLISRAIGYPEK